MTLNPSDLSDFPSSIAQRPSIERLVDSLRGEGEADGYKARVRAAVALGLLPITELARVTPATLEMDTIYRRALLIRQVFTDEPVDLTHRPDPAQPPLGVYRHLRRGNGGTQL